MEKRKVYYGWWIVATGFLIMALVYASVVSCQGLFVIPVTKALGVSRVAFSITSACMALGLTIGSFFAGSFIKKYGLKRIMVICSVIVTLGLLGFSQARAMWQFYVLGIIIGSAFPGLTSIAVSIMINNWFGQKKRGFAMSLVFAGSGVGGMLLMIVLNSLIQNLGWRNAYIANALAIFVIIVPCVLFIIKESPGSMGLTRMGDANEGIKEVAKEEKIDKDAQKKFWILFVSVFLMCVAVNAVLGHQVAYFNEVGFSANQAAAFSAIGLGMLTIGKVVLGIIFDKVGAQKGAFLANLMFALTIGTLLLIANLHVLVYVYILFYGIGTAAGTVTPPLLTGHVVPEGSYAKYVGYINVAVGAGAMVGAMLCAKLYDLYRGYGVAWSVFFVVAIIIIPLQMLSLRKKKENAK